MFETVFFHLHKKKLQQSVGELQQYIIILQKDIDYLKQEQSKLRELVQQMRFDQALYGESLLSFRTGNPWQIE